MTDRDCIRRGITVVVMAVLMAGAWAPWLVADERPGRLMEEVEGELLRLGPSWGVEGLAPAVREAMLAVPRHAFVPPAQRSYAYENRPLPIGFGQTISQPLIVAVMTELLEVDPGDRVFELGTGSGYQAAVLAALGAEVYSVEIVPELGKRARTTLDEAGYGSVQTRIGDGYFGWEEAAPFDAIMVTAAGDHIPPPLLAQLKPGGRMVLPVGSHYFTQQLVLVVRQADGSFSTRELLPVAFVPLTGGH
jgi:protein-L-isoaspartate(D-aspartate) O-methyltransferase